MAIYPVNVSLYQRITAQNLCEDVLERIFECLEDDPESLNACSLVCRAWAACTRRFVFKSIQIRPSNTSTLLDIMTHHLWPTVIPHVRSVEAYGDPNTIYKECTLFDVMARLLTHLTVRDAVIESFDFLIDMISSASQLEAVAVLDVGCLSTAKVQHGKQFLPRSLRRMRLRDCPLTPFFAWIMSHPDPPPLTHVDFGGIAEHELFPCEATLALATPSLQHVTLSFAPGAFGHACSDGNDTLGNLVKLLSGLNPPGLHPNAAHFRRVFGIPHCPTFAGMQTLSVIQFDGFAEDDFRPDLVSTAEFLAPRVCASVTGLRLKRIIFGLNISSAAQLSRYNINWPFFDEIFVSESYARVQVIEFRNSGRANMDNIANYISTRLPQANARDILSFRKVNPTLLAGDYE